MAASTISEQHRIACLAEDLAEACRTAAMGSYRKTYGLHAFRSLEQPSLST